MIRALLMIAGAGFVLAAGAFAAAVAIGGPVPLREVAGT